jgi:raffinose/stachyose/melibiose transport system substrate-binding protein
VKRLMATVMIVACAAGGLFGAGKTTLEFWYPDTWEGEGRAYDAVKAFQSENPGIVINGTPYGDPAILDNLYIASASKTGPDVYFIWLGYQQWPLVNAGFTRDLTPYNARYQWTKKLKKGAIDGVTYKGKMWGVPFNLWSMTFITRRDLLDKYNGGKIPQSMAELRSWGDRLYADGKRLATAASLDGWQLLRFTQTFIGNYVGNATLDKMLNLEGSWDTPQVVAGLRELKLWADKYFQPGFQGVKPSDTKIEFYNGNAAIMFDSPWLQASLNEDGYKDLEVVAFPIPTDSKPWRLDSFPEQISVTTRCKNPDAAVQFADYIARLDTMNRYAKQFSWSPAAVGYQYGGDQPLHRAVSALQDTYGSTPPWDGGLPMEFANVVYEVQDNVCAGKITPEQGAKRLQQGMQEYKAKQKK